MRSKMLRLEHVVLWVSLLGTCACTKADLTSLTVVVTSDLNVPIEMHRLEASFTTVGGTSAPLGLTLNAAMSFPAAFDPAVPGKSGAGDVTVEVRGYLGANLVLAQVVNTAFVKNQATQIGVELVKACVGVACDAGQTCGSGGCGAVAKREAVAWMGGSGIGAVDGGAMDGAGMPVVCEMGQHVCGSQCVDSASPQTCGTSCDPCEAAVGGVATCLGGTCDQACGVGKRLCRSTCIDESAACTATCPSGKHECGDKCLSDVSVNSCGVMCSPCVRPDHGSATCVAGACEFACESGFKVCGGGCIGADECCTDADCPAKADGVGACLATSRTCSYACPAGQHECSGKCVPNAELASCGGRCAACESLEGGTVSCDGKACVFACPDGQRACDGKCISAAAACGDRCRACAASRRSIIKTPNSNSRALTIDKYNDAGGKPAAHDVTPGFAFPVCAFLNSDTTGLGRKPRRRVRRRESVASIEARGS